MGERDGVTRGVRDLEEFKCVAESTQDKVSDVVVLHDGDTVMLRLDTSLAVSESVVLSSARENDAVGEQQDVDRVRDCDTVRVGDKRNVDVAVVSEDFDRLTDGSDRDTDAVADTLRDALDD